MLRTIVFSCPNLVAFFFWLFFLSEMKKYYVPNDLKVVFHLSSFKLIGSRKTGLPNTFSPELLVRISKPLDK